MYKGDSILEMASGIRSDCVFALERGNAMFVFRAF